MATLNPETAIRKLIVDNAGLAAIFGTRIYPHAAPQSAAYPLGVYDRDNTDIQHDMVGAGNLKHVRSVWTWYGTDYDALSTAAGLVEALLDASRVTVTISTDSIQFRTLHMENETREVLMPTDGKGRAVYQIMQTYFVAYQNT